MKASSRWILSCCFLLMLSDIVFGFDQSNSDSMSIPYFPLHKGDVFQWQKETAMGVKSTSQIIYGFDTVIGGKRYIGSSPNSIYRTNGKDTLWRYNRVTGRDDYVQRAFPVVFAFRSWMWGDSVWIVRDGGPPDFEYADKFGCISVDAMGLDDPNKEYRSQLVGCRINGVEYGTITSVDNASKDASHPLSLDLQNFPNPFSSSTKLSFTLGTSVLVDISLYDVVGRCVAELAHTVMEAGPHELDIRTALRPGVYSLVMRSGSQCSTKMMTLVK